MRLRWVGKCDSAVDDKSMIRQYIDTFLTEFTENAEMISQIWNESYYA